MMKVNYSPSLAEQIKASLKGGPQRQSNGLRYHFKDGETGEDQFLQDGDILTIGESPTRWRVELMKQDGKAVGVTFKPI